LISVFLRPAQLRFGRIGQGTGGAQGPFEVAPRSPSSRMRPSCKAICTSAVAAGEYFGRQHPIPECSRRIYAWPTRSREALRLTQPATWPSISQQCGPQAPPGDGNVLRVRTAHRFHSESRVAIIACRYKRHSGAGAGTTASDQACHLLGAHPRSITHCPHVLRFKRDRSAAIQPVTHELVKLPDSLVSRSRLYMRNRSV